MAEKEIKVPDIGDFDVVPIIEIFIKPGDIVQKEQALLVLESDKASMEIPSDEAGKIVSVAVKVGDKVGKGQLIAVIEVSSTASTTQAPTHGCSPLNQALSLDRCQHSPRHSTAIRVACGGEQCGCAWLIEHVGGSHESRDRQPSTQGFAK